MCGAQINNGHDLLELILPYNLKAKIGGLSFSSLFLFLLISSLLFIRKFHTPHIFASFVHKAIDDFQTRIISGKTICTGIHF